MNIGLCMSSEMRIRRKNFQTRKRNQHCRKKLRQCIEITQKVHFILISFSFILCVWEGLRQSKLLTNKKSVAHNNKRPFYHHHHQQQQHRHQGDFIFILSKVFIFCEKFNYVEGSSLCSQKVYVIIIIIFSIQ